MPRSSNARAIPKPSSAKIANSLRRAMDLQADPQTFAQFTASLRNLARQMLDVNKSYAAQDPKVLALFVKRTIATVPLLNLYEDAWPAVQYAKTWLATTSFNHRKKSGKAAKARPVTPPRPKVKPRPVCPEVAPTATVSKQLEPATTRMKSAAVDISYESATAYMSLSEMLRSFDPPLDRLARDLYRCGISSPEELLAMKKWTEGERRSFMRDDVKMSAFKAKQLDIALNRLG